MSMKKEAKLVDAVVALIRETPFGAGERLPAERILANRFATSRHTLRSALRRLEARGILDIRPGSGCYVQSTAGLSAGFSFGASNAASASMAEILEDHLEARWALEPAIGAMAAAKATSRDHADLENELTRISRVMMTGDRENLAEGYAHFQNRIAAATRNPELEKIGRQFAAERRRLAGERADSDPADEAALFSVAVAVVKAIQQGDPQRTGRCLQEFIRQDSRQLRLPPECPLAAVLRRAPTLPELTGGNHP